MDDINLIQLPVCASTNDELYALAHSGAPQGTVISADKQTGGKGTNGRSFFSPEKTGVYMSVLLRGVPGEGLPHVTPLAAVVVSRTLDRLCGVGTRIKKVNDVYLNEKKVCGILTRAETSGKNVNFVIVGIGINLFEPDDGFPPQLNETATFVRTGRDEALRQHVIRDIAAGLLGGQSRLTDKAYLDEMYDYYNSHLIFIGGKEKSPSASAPCR